MLAISRSLLPKESHRIVQESTLLKLSVFMINFLPLVVGVLAMQGRIQVTKSTAQILCGVGVSVTLLALARDICCGCCCLGESNYSSKNQVSPQRQARAVNQISRLPLDNNLLAQLNQAQDKVISLKARLNRLITDHSYVDSKGLYTGLNNIWQQIQKAKQGDEAANLSLSVNIRTLNYIEATITSEESRLVEKIAKATEYEEIMARIEVMRATLPTIQERLKTDLEKSSFAKLIAIFPTANDMQKELQRIRSSEMSFIDYPAQLKQREALIQNQLEKYNARLRH